MSFHSSRTHYAKRFLRRRAKTARQELPSDGRWIGNHRNAGRMGLRPTQPIGTKDAKQTAEIYARISQETFDQVCWGRR